MPRGLFWVNFFSPFGSEGEKNRVCAADQGTIKEWEQHKRVLKRCALHHPFLSTARIMTILVQERRGTKRKSMPAIPRNTCTAVIDWMIHSTAKKIASRTATKKNSETNRRNPIRKVWRRSSFAPYRGTKA